MLQIFSIDMLQQHIKDDQTHITAIDQITPPLVKYAFNNTRN